MEAVVISVVQPQCQYFVLRKKRLCRMTVRPGRQYCGEHEPQPLAADQQIDKRVPCPNDPKHTCYLSKLEKHLTKCNARQVENPPYIVQNINAPEDEDKDPRLPLKDVPVETLRRVIEKVNMLYDKHVKATISTYSPPAEHHGAVAACIAQGDRTDSSRRHLRQASRLMQLAEDEGLVGSDTCYVELGAGKGMLSYYMGMAWCGEQAGAGAGAAASRVLCVDRASLRHKRDNLLAGRAARLRADLRHLALHRAPAAARAAALVGLAKHLCGVATDYALRCMTGAGTVHKVRGALLATCCHHRCERRPYVGARALQELGVTGAELNIMFGIVSWATCGDGRSRQRRLAGRDGDIAADTRTSERMPSSSQDAGSLRDSSRARAEDPPTGKPADTHQPISSRDNADVMHGEESASDTSGRDMPAGLREETGRRAKALLDHGRVLYLREQGFRARLCYYVPTTESLENVCIVAQKEVLS